MQLKFEPYVPKKGVNRKFVPFSAGQVAFDSTESFFERVFTRWVAVSPPKEVSTLAD